MQVFFKLFEERYLKNCCQCSQFYFTIKHDNLQFQLHRICLRWKGFGFFNKHNLTGISAKSCELFIQDQAFQKYLTTNQRMFDIIVTSAFVYDCAFSNSLCQINQSLKFVHLMRIRGRKNGLEIQVPLRIYLRHSLILVTEQTSDKEQTLFQLNT